MVPLRPTVYLIALLALTFASTAVARPQAAQGGERKIVLKPSMLINETAVGDPTGLVDEQETAGDPAAGHGGAPKRPFFPGWAAWPYPVHVAIDLGARYRLTRCFLYNESGDAELVLSHGKPFAWQPKTVKIGGWRQWVEVPFACETRWLRVSLQRPTNLPEMVLYGEPLGPAGPPAKPAPAAPRPGTPMDQLIGANVFIDDPLDTIAPVCGFAREYHSWLWDLENPDLKRRFQPSGAAGGSAWFFDDYYAGLKKRGVTVAPCVQSSVPALFGGANREYKPVPTGKDPEDPASYALHAAHLFQYAARYGSRQVDDALLDLAPGQPRARGLGLLRYIENWNEPDRTWNDRAGRFHPYELAAMCSADYDGHRGKLGRSAGVKSADPAMRLVLGGLAGLDLPYLRAMKLWADANRDGSFPADVINLHHYSSTGNEQGWQQNGHGISPEADRLRERMEEIAAWRNANVPGAELWLTEFGYDTNPASPLHAPALGSMDAEHVQAAWVVRGFLALAAAGVDRAAMFMLRDVKSGGGGVFETCGLVTEKGQWKPKPSWYYVATLRNRLAGMRFDGDVASGDPNVCVYRFRGAGGRTAYALWCTTSEDRKVAGFRLKAGGPSARVVRFRDGSTTGDAAPAQVSGGAVSLDVSETPAMVLVP